MKPIIFLIVLIMNMMILASCGSPAAEVPTNTKPVSDSILRTIQVAPAKDEHIADVIRLNGKIQPDEALQAKVYALASGRIRSVKVELGDYVRKGQVLAEMQSAEVAGVNNDLSLAQSNVDMTKKNLETAKDLYEGKLATERDYINARVDYNKALSELNRARQVSAITGGKNAVYVVKAPISGYVIEKNITGNSEVRQDNNASLFAVADLSRVWIIANVYESDINSISAGDPVKVRTLSSPDKEYDGRIDKIYNVLDPANRTMKVRISMNNASNELKPEMFATVVVSGKALQPMISIPSQAIVLDNSRNYVVVKKGDSLGIKEISLIKRVDDRAFVKGLAAGDQVVTNSQVFIYQALNTR